MIRIGSIALVILLAVPGVAAQSSLPVGEMGDVATGRALYGQYCASCHGKQAEGAVDWQRPDANGELPAPPHDSTGHTWRHTDAELAKMIAEGWRDPFNRTERLTMPAFQTTLTPEEIAAVVAYLKTLWTDDQRQFQAEKNQESLPPPNQN